jgi:hypothetical protein
MLRTNVGISYFDGAPFEWHGAAALRLRKPAMYHPRDATPCYQTD